MKKIERKEYIMKYLTGMVISILFGFSVALALNDDGPYHTSDEVTYTRDMYPLFSKYCKRCHGAGSKLGNWLDYKTAFENRLKIQERVNSKEMPYSGDFTMTKGERELIDAWVESGAKK